MDINRRAIKQEGKRLLVGNWGVAIQLFIITMVVTFVAEFTGIILLPFVAILGQVIIEGANVYYYLGIVHGNKRGLGEVINLSIKQFIRILGISFISGLLTLLGMLLFIIPGIILSLRYSMAIYVAIDNENLGIMDCLKESARITNGYKTDIFMFTLSFIPLSLTALITFGLSLLYVVPYIGMSQAVLYNQIKMSKYKVDEGNI